MAYMMPYTLFIAWNTPENAIYQGNITYIVE